MGSFASCIPDSTPRHGPHRTARPSTSRGGMPETWFGCRYPSAYPNCLHFGRNVVQHGGKRNARLWKSVLFTRAARVTDVALLTHRMPSQDENTRLMCLPWGRSLGDGVAPGDTSPCPVQGKCSDGSALPHFRLGLSHEAAAVANFPKVWSRVDRELKASLKIGRTRIQANQISATQGNPEYLWANRTQAGEHPS